jgi:phage/plasmid-like protein (TIGR03299 family)
VPNTTKPTGPTTLPKNTLVAVDFLHSRTRQTADNDGSSKFTFLVTPVRIVCANTQAAALGAAKASWGIRHTGGAHTAIAEARHALKLSWRYVAAFEAEAARLYAQPMDDDQMWLFANTLVDVEGAQTPTIARNRERRAGGIVTLWRSSPTIAPIGGTRWAAYNAVTEYVDHVAPVRGARDLNDASAARALRSITTAASAGSMKAKAFSMLQTL